MNPNFRRRTSYWIASLLLICLSGILHSQASSSPAPASNAKQAQEATPPKPVRASDRRHATKLYLASSKLFEKEKFEEAMSGYEKAARLDPENGDYPLAASVARSHAVTTLIQAAAKDRTHNEEAAARAALAHALELDPENGQLKTHLFELGDDALRGHSRPTYEAEAGEAGEAVELAPAPALHSFHLHTNQREIIQQVFKAYGITATVDESVRTTVSRLDLDNASFARAAHILGMLTNSFYVPLDAHRALVVRDTKENRQQFQRQEFETVYLSGLTKEELTDVGNLAKNVFDVQTSVTEPTSGTITLRAHHQNLEAFNATLSGLIDGRSQVVLDVHLIQLAHTTERNTGVHQPQNVSAMNVYTEEQSILNSNQALVQQIISSGLASSGETAKILGILLASGQVSGSSLLTSGFALFGGGLTASALAPGALSANFNLNSSESRELDQIQIRLGDGEDATLKSGMRYPIQSSSYSSLGTSTASIAGLTGAGNSSSLAALAASYGIGSSVSGFPQVTYEDLGMTLKATPRVLRSGEVTLKIDMKIDALAGNSINGNPVLSNRAFSGVVSIKEGESVEVVSEVDKNESRAISGMPGLSEIPGMNNLTGNDKQKNYATLLMIFTPHVVRGIQSAGHSPMMRIERGQGTR
jgi:Flp pilus assembly secretin CpaC